jgi:isoquinoline 1-oxidoreductase beta subunit
VLLCQAGAKRWDTDWESCDTGAGFVFFGKRKIAFAELVAEAAELTVPDPVPLRASPSKALSGRDMPRLDVAAKVDGSANFAGDIRLPDMLYASVRAGPIGDTRLKSVKDRGAAKINGFVKLIKTDRWVAALGTNWWAANKALDAVAPVFETTGRMPDSGVINATLDRMLAKGTAFSAKANLKRLWTKPPGRGFSKANMPSRLRYTPRSKPVAPRRSIPMGV